MTDKTLKDKTIDIKGKKYAMVKDRVEWLSDNKDGEYSIDTDYKYYPNQRMWVVKAILTIGHCHYSGLAQEVESDDTKAVNNASALENCETSAIGRACAAYGLGIQESYASANEMNKKPRVVKYASDKQLKWIRDEAHKANDQLGDQAETDEWIELVLEYPVAKIPGFKTADAVDKIRAWGQSEPGPDYEGGDVVVDVTDKDLEDLAQGELPY
jgi:hypothetical protein